MTPNRELDRRIDYAAGGPWGFGIRPDDRLAATLPEDDPPSA